MTCPFPFIKSFLLPFAKWNSQFCRITNFSLPSAVPKDDKQVIRSRLATSILEEPDNRLALQNALVVAKIARYEYPNDWPEAISSFLDAIRASVSQPLRMLRALLTLLRIIKELSTGRLQRSRQYLQAATPEIISLIDSTFRHFVESWLNRPNSVEMQQSLLAIKILRRLLISGYEHPNRNQEAASLWSFSYQTSIRIIPLIHSDAPNLPNDLSVLLGRHALQFAKLHHGMARDHPAAFALLPDALGLIQSYWGWIVDFGKNSFGSEKIAPSAISSAKIGNDGDANDQSIGEKIILKGLLIIRACVKMVHNPAQTFKYHTPEDKDEKNKATERVRNHVLRDSFVREVMQVLMERFFVFRASDLREWQEEPEEWEKREEGEGEDWEFSVRSCSEKLFLDLAINYKEIIVEPLLRSFSMVTRQEYDEILFKDSVYSAIGLSASVIHPELDFDAFIRDVLVKEMQRQTPGYNVIRRRAAILLAQWISIKISQDTRPVVYQIYQHLLNRNDALNDQVVRVTAGRQFQTIANDWEFQAAQFLPYAEGTLAQLIRLIEEVELTDTKMALLNTVSIIVERLEQHITPFAQPIVTLLPSLWDQSGEEHLMKQAILTILARLLNSMRAESLPLHHITFPIIRGAIEPDSETQIYLLEDALDLWTVVLAQTPSGSASPDLLDLMRYIYPIYELGSENLRKALEIAESYLLLSPSHVLSDGVRVQLLTTLTDLIGRLRPEANGYLCSLVENMIRYAYKLGGEEAVSQLTSDLVQTGFFGKISEGLRGSWTAHCTTGPLAKEPPVDGMMETDYFSILARLVLGCTNAFFQACQITTNTDLESTMKWLLEEWFSHFENIGDPKSRKLMCLALTKLLGTRQPFILLNLQSLVSMWTDVVTELRGDSEDPMEDSLMYNPDREQEKTESHGSESPEDTRRTELTFSDQVHTVQLPQWINYHLREAITGCGGDQAFQEQWLVNVDQDVVKGFTELGIYK